VQKATPTRADAWRFGKKLPLRVGDRPLLAKALRVLLPGGYSGPPLTVYRGTRDLERRLRLYQFSWATDVAVARKLQNLGPGQHRRPNCKV
jgi:hypothetical protein